MIAVGGETVTIDYESNEVMVNSALLWEPYINLEASDPMQRRNDAAVIEYTVPDGYVFVMGDNRNHSTDSRDKEVGCISMDSAIGKVIYPCVGMKKDAGDQLKNCVASGVLNKYDTADQRFIYALISRIDAYPKDRICLPQTVSGKGQGLAVCFSFFSVDGRKTDTFGIPGRTTGYASRILSAVKKEMTVNRFNYRRST